MSKTLSLLFLLLLFSSCASKAPEYSSASLYTTSEIGRSLELQSDTRMIAYSVTLELIVKNTEITKNKLLDQIKNLDGFIVRESEYFITTRIPSEKMEEFVNHSKTLGKIENESKTGTDITDQYRDNVIRLESLRSVRGRYLTLLEKANAVSDIISIEKELERVNLEIETLEGRIKYAEASVAYSSITVRFREKAKPGPLGWIFYGLYQGVRWLFVWD